MFFSSVLQRILFISLIGSSSLHGVVNQNNKDYFIEVSGSKKRKKLALIRNILSTASLEEKIELLHHQNKFGDTPLHNAALYKNVNAVILFIKNGAQVNQQNLYGDTPLHHTAFYGNIQIAHLLVENGANVNLQNRLGYTPLHNAIISKNLNIVILLIKLNADLHIKNCNNKSSFDLLTEYGIDSNKH
jgi:ankyrin repeat protein